MYAGELINDMIPPLKVTDKCKMALLWMEELRLSELPVIDNGKYLGILNEQTIYDQNDEELVIAQLELHHTDVFVSDDKHFYDVIKLAQQNNTQLVAVVDASKKFQGVIAIKDTVMAMSRSCATIEPGGIIVLSLFERDYTLSHISRLVEENESKILSSYVEEDSHDPFKIKLTIKINKTDLTRVIATLERHEYKIIAKFHESEITTNQKERLDLLFKFLDL